MTAAPGDDAGSGSRDGTETGPIRSESSEDRGDAKGAVLGWRGERASRHKTSGAHDPDRGRKQWRCRRSSTSTRLWMHPLWRGLRTSPSGRRLSPGRESFPWRPSLLTGVQGEESRSEMDETCERYAAGEDLDLLPTAPNMEAGGSHLQATAEEERIVD